MRPVRTDCSHYVGDRPCAPHKKFGVVCEGCEYHETAGQRVLIVKLDAMGDVLRTTCILQPLMVQLGASGAEAGVKVGLPSVTWITRPDSIPLLARNPYIARAVPTGSAALETVTGELFDLVICLDASRDAARLAAMARQASTRDGHTPGVAGFTMHHGTVVPADPRAETWWQMGLWDDLKRANTRSYQDHMMSMLGLHGEPGDYVLELGEEELVEARQELRNAGLWPGERFLALNVGGGGRWEYKRWTEPHMLEFMQRVSSDLGMRVALLGGDAERPLIERLLAGAPKGAFFPGVHPVRRFAGILAAADVLVTGDTLAMHLSLAAKRPTVVLFGPSSLPEIEVYGRGEKIAPEMDCLCCYLMRCDKKPYCQELIEPAQVLAAVERLLSAPPAV